MATSDAPNLFLRTNNDLKPSFSSLMQYPLYVDNLLLNGLNNTNTTLASSLGEPLSFKSDKSGSFQDGF